LAAESTLVELVAAGDFRISGKRVVDGGGRREPPLASIPVLEAAADRHRGTPGGKLRKRALPLLRSPVDSPPESELRLLIIANGFAEAVVNCPVPTRDRVLHADLGYPELRIAIEYEGAYHFDVDRPQTRRDVERGERMRDAHWCV